MICVHMYLEAGPARVAKGFGGRKGGGGGGYSIGDRYSISCMTVVV